MGIPLHGKHAYIRIKIADSHIDEARLTSSLRNGETLAGSDIYLVTSYATDYTFNLDFQNVSRAIVLGTDGILDVKSQGLLASSTISMILTDDQVAIMTALGATLADAQHGGSRSVDFANIVSNAIGGNYFDGTMGIDIQIIPVDVFKNFADGDGLLGNNVDDARGYVFELKEAAIISFNTRGSAGEYNISRLMSETGQFVLSNLAKN